MSEDADGAGLTWEEIDDIIAEDPDDRGIRMAHGFTRDDDWEDLSLLCRNGCGETYHEIAIAKIRNCPAAPAEHDGEAPA